MRKISLVFLLGVLIACACMTTVTLADWSPDASLWETVNGSTATIPLARAVAEFFGQGESAPIHETTPSAYFYLCNNSYKTTDLIFVTMPAEEDFAIAQEAGAELEVIPVVREGLVFLNNTANPVDNLTVEQLRQIYTGTITNWAEVGGLDERVTAYQRDVRSGSQTVFI